VKKPSHFHISARGSHDWVFPADIDDRRIFAQRVSDHRVGDKAYFAALGEELRNGGLAALLYHLQHRDISQFNPLDIPMTAEKRRQQLLSLDILARWWMQVLLRGYVWESKVGTPTFQRWHEFSATQLLMASHFEYCRAVPHYHPANEAQLRQFMEDRIGHPWARGPRGHDWPVREIELPWRPDGSHDAAGDQRQAALALDPAPDDVEEEAEPLAPLVTDWRERRVVYSSRPPGYRLGSLDEARARFAEAMNGIPMPWQPLTP
jgi:hypothetical protein